MAYYAILTPAFIGHVNPMLVLARAIQKRGHRVVFVAPIDCETKAQRAGLEFIQICANEFPLGEWDRMTAHLGELTGLKANRFAGYWLSVMARGLIRELPALIEKERFDGIVMDQICIGAEAVCAVHKMPLAVACNALAMHVEWGVSPCVFSWRYNSSLFARLRNLAGYTMANASGIPVFRAVAPYRRKHRLGQMRLPHINHLRPSLVQVAQQPSFFDFPREYLPPHFHYTGPWKEPASPDDCDFPWERLDGRPLIYASLGTLQNRLQHVFQMITEACATPDAQLVLALGNKNAIVPSGLAGNPIVVGYAPQTALLKRAHLVITHAGLNTTLETLMEGLPMVAIPITNDQPGVAARLEYLGAGVKIPVKQLTTDRLRNAIDQIRSNSNFRTTARALADKIAQVNGQALAAELIETAFVTRKPVISSPTLVSTPAP